MTYVHYIRENRENGLCSFGCTPIKPTTILTEPHRNRAYDANCLYIFTEAPPDIVK